MEKQEFVDNILRCQKEIKELNEKYSKYNIYLNDRIRELVSDKGSWLDIDSIEVSEYGVVAILTQEYDNPGCRDEIITTVEDLFDSSIAIQKEKEKQIKIRSEYCDRLKRESEEKEKKEYERLKEKFGA